MSSGAQCLLRRDPEIESRIPRARSAVADSFLFEKVERASPPYNHPSSLHAPGCPPAGPSCQGFLAGGVWPDAQLLPFLTDSPLELGPDTSFSLIPTPGLGPDTGSLRPSQAAPRLTALPAAVPGPVLADVVPAEPERLLCRAVS